MTKETQAWIKELENNSNLSYPEDSKGDLLCPSKEISYQSGMNEVSIGNTYLTIDQLEALLSHMKQYSKVRRSTGEILSRGQSTVRKLFQGYSLTKDVFLLWLKKIIGLVFMK